MKESENLPKINKTTHSPPRHADIPFICHSRLRAGIHNRRESGKNRTVPFFGVVIVAGLMVWLAGCKSTEKVVKKKIITAGTNVVKPEKKPEVKTKIETEEVFSVKWGNGENQIPIAVYTNKSKRLAELVIKKRGPEIFTIDKRRNIYIENIPKKRVVKFSNNKIVARYLYTNIRFSNPMKIFVDNKKKYVYLYFPYYDILAYKKSGIFIGHYISEDKNVFRDKNDKEITKEYLDTLDWMENWKKKYKYVRKDYSDVYKKPAPTGATFYHEYIYKGIKYSFCTTNNYVNKVFLWPIIEYVDNKGRLILGYPQDLRLHYYDDESKKHYSQYKEDCDMYFLIYNKYGKRILEFPIHKHIGVERIQGFYDYLVGNIYINTNGNIYELFCDTKGIHILKHRLVEK